MPIYTRTGDAGETGLFGGARVRKDDSRVEAYGAVDELNACLGACRASALPRWDALLQRIQADLLHVGADLAAPEGAAPGGLPRIGGDDVAALEHEIDAVSAELPPLRHFVLPAGPGGAAALHVARTVCRRAERRVVALAAEAPVNGEALRYLNRLSDLLFVLARAAVLGAGGREEPWQPRRGARP